MRNITAVVVAATAIAGCAATKSPPEPPSIPGVQISTEERQACAAQGCTVWTEEALKAFGQQVFRQGVQQGMRMRSL